MELWFYCLGLWVDVKACSNQRCTFQTSSGRVFLINTRAQRNLNFVEPEIWIIYVIVKQHLVQIGRIDGPTEYLPRMLAAIKSSCFGCDRSLSLVKWLEPRPESGRDWLMCSKFARQRYLHLVRTAPFQSCSLVIAYRLYIVYHQVC